MRKADQDLLERTEMGGMFEVQSEFKSPVLILFYSYKLY